MNRLQKADWLQTLGFAAAAIGLALLGFGSGRDWTTFALGLVALVSSLFSVLVALRTEPGRPATWVSVGRDASVALAGFGLMVAPWTRPLGGALGLIGVMGRLYFLIFASALRGRERRTP